MSGEGRLWVPELAPDSQQTVLLIVLQSSPESDTPCLNVVWYQHEFPINVFGSFNIYLLKERVFLKQVL